MPDFAKSNLHFLSFSRAGVQTFVYRLSFLWLFASAITVQAQSALSQKVGFECVQCSPADALVALSRQSGINIAFNNRWFKNCSPIDITRQDAALGDIIQEIVACARLNVAANGNIVVLSRRNTRFTLSGYVLDAQTGERLIGVSLRLRGNGGKGVSSNEFGFYSLELEEGEHQLYCSYIGYAPNTIAVSLSGNQMRTIRLSADTRLPEVLVSGDQQKTPYNRTVGTPRELPLDQLRYLPMPGGEADITRLAALQTGVQTGVDGLGGLHVRGGNADQNLFLLDDVPVYSPGHALGLFSIFNPAIVSSARLWKGDFPARYGGRVSSVMDIRTRDGNFQQWKAGATAGLFASSAEIEGPIAKDKASFLAAGRITYLDPWIQFFSKRGNLLNISSEKIRYTFFDGNIKLNYIVSPRHRIYGSFYNGNDQFKNIFQQNYLTNKGLVIDRYGLDSEWGNIIAALRWNYIINPKLFANTTLRYSRFYYRSRLDFISDIYFSSGKESVLANYVQLYQTLIRDLSVKTDLSWYQSQDFVLRSGVAYTSHIFQPGTLSANFLQPGLQSPTTIDSLQNLLINNEVLHANELELYSDAEWTFYPGWRLDGGLNAAVFFTGATTYQAYTPRLRLQYRSDKGWGFWLGHFWNVQYLHQIGNFNFNLPFELWVPSTRQVKPERMRQFSLGISYQRKDWVFQLEGYHKRLVNVLTFLSNNDALYTGGALDASGWEDRLAAGFGTSRGLECSIEKTAGATTGSISYTLSRTDRTFEDFNSGSTFPFRYDRRHDLKISLRQRLWGRLDLSGIWVFATGIPITLSGVKFRHESVEGEVTRDVQLYTEVNGYRLPAYHRLDVSLNYQFGIRASRHSVQLGAYNAYNRQNPFFLYLDAGSNIRGKAIQYTLLPILPSFRYEVKF